MHYYIDGYNYLFRQAECSDNIQSLREQFICDLNHQAKIFNLNITIVFDAHHQEGEALITHYHHVEIIYTSKGQSADSYFLEFLASVKNPKIYTLVTSDKVLARQARQLFVKTKSIEDFIRFLSKKKCIRKNLSKEASSQKNVFLDNDDYEKIFTKQIKKEKNVPLEQKSSRKESKREVKNSDYERWLKIFENRVKKNGA